MLLTSSQSENQLIILNKGDRLIETLTQLVTEYDIQGGFLAGVGALEQVELGYYALQEKTYLRKTFEHEDFELLSLNGNISLKDNKPYIHVHVSLGRRDFSVIGGHLFEAIVAVTAEIAVIPFGKMPLRMMNERIGLALICGI